MVTVLGQKITTTLAIFMDVLKGNPNLVFRKKSVCLKFCIPDLLLLLAQLGKRTPPWRRPAGLERSSLRSARLLHLSYYLIRSLLCSYLALFGHYNINTWN